MIQFDEYFLNLLKPPTRQLLNCGILYFILILKMGGGLSGVVSLYSLAVSWEATGPCVPLETQNWLLQKAGTDTNRCTPPVNHCATTNH